MAMSVQTHGHNNINPLAASVAGAFQTTESRHFAGSASETAAATLSATGGFDDRRAEL